MRFLCPQHGHILKVKQRPIQLSTEKCSVCRWENRPWTLKDFAVELENIAANMRFASENEHYDPHGITFAQQFQDFVGQWLKHVNPSYRDAFIKYLEIEK